MPGLREGTIVVEPATFNNAASNGPPGNEPFDAVNNSTKLRNQAFGAVESELTQRYSVVTLAKISPDTEINIFADRVR